MKKMRKTILAAVLIGIMMLFSACSKDFDAQGMVQAYMEMVTKGESENYCKITGESAEEAAEEYQILLDSIASAFDEVGISDDTKQSITDAFLALLAQSKYEVHEANKVSDGYEVALDIYPIQGAFSGIQDTLTEEIFAQYMANPDMTDQELYDLLFTRMAELMGENMSNLTYGDPQTVDLKIVKDSDNNYAIENDYEIGEMIGTLLIDQSELG